MSAGRKSPTVVMPVSAAMVAGSPICNVEAGERPKKSAGTPWWKIGWAWLPRGAVFFGETLNFRHPAMAPPGKGPHKRKFYWPGRPPVVGAAAAHAGIVFRRQRGH